MADTTHEVRTQDGSSSGDEGSTAATGSTPRSLANPRRVRRA